MKFKFPLQKVLDHRYILQDLAQKDFEEAQSESNRQKDLLMDMITQLHEARQRAGAIQTGPDPRMAEGLKQIHEYTKLQDIRIAMQKRKVQDAEKVVEEKREILRQKAIDSKIMERLKEQKRDQFLRDMKSEEQKEADELNILRFDADAKDGE